MDDGFIVTDLKVETLMVLISPIALSSSMASGGIEFVAFAFSALSHTCRDFASTSVSNVNSSSGLLGRLKSDWTIWK